MWPGSSCPELSPYPQSKRIQRSHRSLCPPAISAAVGVDPTGELTPARDQISYALAAIVATDLGPRQQPQRRADLS
jgi:hypothetical protein